MIVEIDALDTLFFRDGKPFTMGDETWADATFPPYPSVIYGALRSAYFADHIDIFHKLNQEGKLDSEDDPTKKLKIRNLLIKINDGCYFPAPFDCVKDKDTNENRLSILHLQSSKGIVSSYPALDKLLVYPDVDKKIENVTGAVLNDVYFRDYLCSTSEELPYLKINDYIIDEPKIGIGISNVTHTSETGKLYRINMKRLKSRNGAKTSIVVDFDGLNIDNNSFVKLGGEGKATYLRRYDTNIDIVPPKFEQNEKQFKMILTTPAIFTNGWLPEWIDKKTLEGDYNGLQLKLLAAAIGKPVNIGGFDMKAKRPKAMYRAVPAGSVYYFEIAEGDINEVVAIFHQRSISDVYPEKGFGVSYIGCAR